jgi:hypothetical protein
VEQHVPLPVRPQLEDLHARAPDGVHDGLAEVGVRHQAVLRTSVEVATYDAEFAAFYNGLTERFVVATADQLRRDLAAGRLRDLDPATVAPALVLMVERCNHMLIGLQGRPPQEVVEAIISVWVHALYPDSVASPHT